MGEGGGREGRSNDSIGRNWSKGKAVRDARRVSATVPMPTVSEDKEEIEKENRVTNDTDPRERGCNREGREGRCRRGRRD